MTKAHSNLGASSASRWMNCPGSNQLIASLPFKPEAGPHAALGTAAHKLAEVCLQEGCAASEFIGCEEDGIETTEEMAEAVQQYLNYIEQKLSFGGDLQVEVKFDLSSIEPGMFGTCDAVISDDFLNTLEVIDYKHGVGVVVSPVENAQLKYYALGAIRALNTHPDTKVLLTVVQPRAIGETIKSWETSVANLESFAFELKAAAEKTRELNPEINMGSWCKFCDAAGAFNKKDRTHVVVCPKMKDKTLEVTKAAFGNTAKGKTIILPEPASLELNELTEVLNFADTIESWLKSVEAYALGLAERGESISGYKLVARRANRKWGDETRTKTVLTQQLGLGNSIFTEPKLKSPAQIEALKVDKDLVATLTVTPDNGVSLVPVSDKRAEVNPTKTLDSMFGPRKIS